MTEMAFATVGNVIVALHTANPPSEAEWAAYIAAVKTVDLREIRAIAFTDGGAPNSAQRKALNEALKNRACPGVVVSASTMVRSVVTALSWFNPLVKAFSPDRAADAYRYLNLTPAEIQAVREQVRVLHARFSTPLRCVSL